MSPEQRAGLDALQAEIDRRGREVARVRVRGGSAAEMERADAALFAATRRQAEFMRRLGFRVAFGA